MGTISANKSAISWLLPVKIQNARVFLLELCGKRPWNSKRLTTHAVVVMFSNRRFRRPSCFPRVIAVNWLFYSQPPFDEGHADSGFVDAGAPHPAFSFLR